MTCFENLGIFASIHIGDMSTVRNLHESGISIDVRNQWDNTALILACSKGHMEIVRFLVENDADVNARNIHGWYVYVYVYVYVCESEREGAKMI